jgi:hypothetical protein
MSSQNHYYRLVTLNDHLFAAGFAGMGASLLARKSPEGREIKVIVASPRFCPFSCGFWLRLFSAVDWRILGSLDRLNGNFAKSELIARPADPFAVIIKHDGLPEAPDLSISNGYILLMIKCSPTIP